MQIKIEERDPEPHPEIAVVLFSYPPHLVGGLVDVLELYNFFEHKKKINKKKRDRTGRSGLFEAVYMNYYTI